MVFDLFLYCVTVKAKNLIQCKVKLGQQVVAVGKFESTLSSQEMVITDKHSRSLHVLRRMSRLIARQL